MVVRRNSENAKEHTCFVRDNLILKIKITRKGNTRNIKKMEKLQLYIFKDNIFVWKIWSNRYVKEHNFCDTENSCFPGSIRNERKISGHYRTDYLKLRDK